MIFQFFIQLTRMVGNLEASAVAMVTDVQMQLCCNAAAGANRGLF